MAAYQQFTNVMKLALQRKGISMAKRPSLAESMKAAAKEPVANVASPSARHEANGVSALPATGEREAPSLYRAKTREGMKRLTVVVPPEEHRRVKRLSADTDRTIEDLMREAIASLLERHNA
ncbi:ribbon-helix-helix domain-containing protein [Sphingomonas silueang]|jgi:hypothetical protein|uniref:ribbon-helix-helix domain-containing protein n=1 Tax=Sphingomonas silueang TaxID=3156617 RepID=UPI0028E6A24B|nr:ribbon-helix-helix domain-containing protein [uncultured Sphingomonas sp.]